MPEERAEPQGASKPAEGAESFKHEEHRANARSWYDCSPHTVAGALHGARKKELTRDEVKSLVRSFLKHEDETEREGTE